MIVWYRVVIKYCIRKKFFCKQLCRGVKDTCVDRMNLGQAVMCKQSEENMRIISISIPKSKIDTKNITFIVDIILIN